MIGTRKAWLLAALAAAVCVGAIGAPAGATTFTLTDNNSSITIDPESQAGVFNWTVDGIGGNLYQEWFWFRIGDAAGTGQQSLNTLTLSSAVQLAPGILDTVYTGQGLEIKVRSWLTGGGFGSQASDLAQTITVKNNTGETLHFFQYADFDLLGISGDDLVTVENANAIRQTKQGSAVALSEAIVGPAPAVWETGFYASTLSSLNSGANYDLSGETFGVTKGPGDMTWAAEWNLAPGTTIISKDIRLVVPEPVTMFSAFMAISGLGLYIRKRTRVAV